MSNPVEISVAYISNFSLTEEAQPHISQNIGNVLSLVGCGAFPSRIKLSYFVGSTRLMT